MEGTSFERLRDFKSVHSSVLHDGFGLVRRFAAPGVPVLSNLRKIYHRIKDLGVYSHAGSYVMQF